MGELHLTFSLFSVLVFTSLQELFTVSTSNNKYLLKSLPKVMYKKITPNYGLFNKRGQKDMVFKARHTSKMKL